MPNQTRRHQMFVRLDHFRFTVVKNGSPWYLLLPGSGISWIYARCAAEDCWRITDTGSSCVGCDSNSCTTPKRTFVKVASGCCCSKSVLSGQRGNKQARTKMGPPPPPSASYLWKFDDTDDDDDDEKGDLCDRFPVNHNNNNHHLFHHQKNDDHNDKPVVKADTSVATTTVTPAKHSVAHQMIETTQTNLSWSIASSTATATATATGTTECTNHNDKDTHSIDSRDDDDDDFHNDGDDDGHDSKKGTNQKKRKKSKKKRKKKISSSSSPNTTLIVDPMMILPTTTATSTTTFTTTTTRHHVTFSCVTIHTFSRCFGRDVVPTHGGWPLGMEYHCQCHDNDDNNNNVHDDHDNDDTGSAHDHGDSNGNHNNDNTNNCWYSIDEYETEKRERLQQRYQKLVVAPSNPPLDSPNNKKSKGPNKTNRTNIDHDYTAPDLVLETRQWDYKNRQKNPLFGILHESDRMNLLQSSANNSQSTSSSSPPPDTVNETTNRHHPSSSGRRSNHHNHHLHQQQQHGDHPSAAAAASNDNHHTNIYTSTYVNSIRNALEQLRIDRSTGIGCQCRKLQVPILSTSSTTNTSNNKKGHHPKRLKLQKLKDELAKRQLVWSEEQSREEMEQLLHDAVEQEPCCLYTDTCFCARNGIGCQADVCSCWHRRHHPNSTGSSSGSGSSSSGPTKSQKGSSSSSSTTTTTVTTIQEIQERCGNTVGGMYVVDDHHIDTFRNDYLQRLKVCPFISVDES